MAIALFCFMVLCMAVGGCFLVRKGIKENRLSLTIIGSISVGIVLTIIYLIYRVSDGPFAFH
jgi:hypothetical protein